jgi:hypothetical protein
VPEKQLIVSLFAMCNPKVNLVTKERKNPKFDNPDEKFTLNLNWKNASVKVTLVPVQSAKKKGDADDEKEKDKLNEGVMKERTAVMQGNIIKVMKTNKDSAVPFKDLVQKTMEMCHLFKAQPDMVKKAIGELINMAYIRRDDKDRTKLWYIA